MKNTNQNNLMKILTTYAACSILTTCAWNGIKESRLEEQVNAQNINQVDANTEPLYRPVLGNYKDYPATFDVEETGIKNTLRVYEKPHLCESIFYLPTSETKKPTSQQAFKRIPIDSIQYNRARNAVGLVWLDMY